MNRRRWTRAFVLGLALLTGGSTYLSTAGHAADPAADAIAEGLQSFSQALAGLDGLEELASPVAFSDLLPTGSEGLALADVFRQSLGDRLAAQLPPGGTGFTDLADVESFLNDPDGENGTADDGTYGDVVVDIGATITPVTTGVHDVTLTLALSRAGTTPLVLPLPAVDATGGPLATDLGLTGSLGFRLDTSLPEESQFALSTSAPQSLATTFDLDLGSTSYDVDLGLTEVTVSGTADIGAALSMSLVDPTPDGRITADDWSSTAPLDLFEVTPGASHANLSLTLDSDIPGVPTGTVTLTDDDLVTGIGTPVVTLGALGDFRNMTPVDFLGGLAHVAGALDALQTSGPADIELPLMSDRLSELLAVNQRLKAFFTSTGLSDPATPLTLGPGPGLSAAEYATLLAQFDTLQEIEQPLAVALGVPLGILAFAFDPTSRRFTLTLKKSDTRPAVGAEVDLGNELERLGVVGVEDAASSVSVTPSVDLDVGVSVDLTPRTSTETLLHKFGIETAGTELTIDAPVSADLDLVGKIGFLGLDLADGNPAGSVPVLERKDDGVPMLSVDLDGGEDDLLTLFEVFELSAAGPSFSGLAGAIDVTVNAEVPSFDLRAAATAGGTEIASGDVTVTWPDITTGSPTVTADTTFQDELLDFDFDHSNPLALFSQVTTALRTFADAVDALSEQAAGEVLTRDLPFSGQSFDDLANRLADVSTSVDALLTDPPATLQVLEAELERRLAEALEVPPSEQDALLGIDLTSAGGQSSLLFDLSYGLCSAAGAGCTSVTGPLSLPFTFDLGESTGGIVGTQGDGQVSLDYRAMASLDFGVELPQVAAGATNGSVPTVTGSPSAFVVDTSALSLSAGLQAGGTLTASVGPLELSLGAAGDEVEAKIAAAIALDNDVAPVGPTRIAVPSAEFESFVTGLAPSDIGPAEDDRVTCAAPVGGPYDACARVPVYDGLDKLGEIRLTWDDLTALSGPSGPTLTGQDEVFENLIARGLDFSRILEGMQRVLTLLTESLDGASYGQSLPVVGDALDAGADVATLFNSEVVTPLSALATELEGVDDPTVIRTELQSFFVDALALPDGSSLLKDRDADGIDADDVVVTVLCDDGLPMSEGDLAPGPVPCTSDHSVLHLYDVQIGFAIGQSGATGTPVDFDLGLPGLRLEMADEDGPADDLRASATWELDLAFGLSVNDGFYLRTDNPNNQPAPGGNELALAAGIELPNTLTGDIAFLPFELTDRTEPANDTAPKDLNLTFGLDVKGGGTSSRLALTDLVAGIDPADDTAVGVTLGGDVNLNFHFRTGPFGTQTSGVPSFVADFLLDWSFSTGTLDGQVGDLTIQFNNVGIDLGSLVGEFLEPILVEARRLTKPLQPVVDIVTAPIPGLTDAAAAFGCPATLPFPEIIAGIDLCTLSLLDVYEKSSGTDLTLIRQLISLIEFINAVDNPGAQPTLTLGSFTVNAEVANASALSPNEKDQLFAGSTPPTGKSETPKPLENLGETVKAAVDKAKKTGTDKGGFTFPAFDDPSRLFMLLLGKDVTLIHWDAGSLEAAVTIPLEIGPPIGPLPISLGITISFGVRGHFAVGYDTKGIRQAFQELTDGVDTERDTVLATIGTLFAGVGIDDRLRVNGEPTGEDIPEITLFGSLTAKAALDLLLVEAGVRGGVAAELNANLHDGGLGPDNHTDPTDRFSHHPENLDGVLRLDELASFLGNPVCLFDYDGRITAFLEAYIDYTLGEETFTIVGPVTLYDFSEVLNQACQTEPVLAHVTNDTDGDGVGDGAGTGNLVLHAGAFKDLREFQEEVENERFVVRQLDAGGTKFSVTAFGYTQEFGGVNGKLFGDGGAGDDTIVLEPGATLAEGTGEDGDVVASTVVPFTRRATLCGGAGNDVLRGGGAGDGVYGDGTADTTTLSCSPTEVGSDGADDVDGGSGHDDVFGGGGADKLKGGNGGDTIDAGTGSDVVLGGGGGDGDEADHIRGGPDTASGPDADVIFGSTGNDVVDGGADADTIEGEAGNDVLRGGPGDDTIQGRDQDDRIEGQGDDDILYGGNGDDAMLGGDGDDDAFGEAGDDTISGGADDDDLVGGRDNTGVTGDTTTGDTLNGEAGRDYLLGDEGTIARPAGQDTGTLACTGTFAGDDTMNGGADADVMHGCAGIDLMHGDDGADTMLGNDGDDDMFGDDGPDAMFGDLGADDMSGGAGDDRPMRGGDGPDDMSGNDGRDEMFGDSGDDLMKGNADDDDMRGGIGEDVMEGNAASDTMNGDGGNDLVIGGTSTAGQPDAGDVLYGSTGTDHLIGDNGIRTELYDLDAADPSSLGGKDRIDGGSEDDRAFGGLDDDEVRGGSGRDHLEGNNASDEVFGEDGADNLLGGTSQRSAAGATYPDAGDALHGGDLDDVLLGDNGSIDNVDDGAGTPVLQGRGLSVERDVVLYDLGYSPEASKSGDDTANGGNGTDIVLGQGASDTLHGDAADDFVAGGQARDTVHGDAGEDDLVGGSYVVEGSGDDGPQGQLDDGDTVLGGDEQDVVIGDNGQVLRAGDMTSDITESRGGMRPRLVEIYDLGDTPVPSTSGSDWLQGESGADVLLGQSGTDRIAAGSAEDYAEGGPGSDWIEGNDGDDDLIGGSSIPLRDTASGQLDAADVVWGGSGDDLVLGDNAIVNRSGTPHELTFRIGTNPLGFITDRRALELLDLVNGGDTLLPATGRFGGDFLSGQAGVDVLLGQDGGDAISGGSDDDYGEGQGGEDSLLGDDPLAAVPSTTLPAPGWPESPTEGHALDEGVDGQDDLLGGKSELGFRDAGDTIRGNGESDFILGDNGTAVRDITGSDGARVDRPYALRYATPIPLNAAKLRVADTDAGSTRFCDASLPQCERDGAFGGDDLFGNDGDDFAYGQDGDDSIWGGAHDDDLYGELGNDELYGEAGDDAILGDRGGIRDRYEDGARTFPLSVTQVPKVSYEGFGEGTVTRLVDLLHEVNGDAFVGASSDAPMPYNGRDEGGDDRIRGGLDDDSIHAGYGDDLANGDSGGDRVFGDDGADVLWGGKGCDEVADAGSAVCFPAGVFDPAPHRADGSTVPEFTDYLLGGKGGTSQESLDGANGSDLLDWRPRGSYTEATGCTPNAWPADLAPLGKKGVSTTIDPCSWFEMTDLHDTEKANDQHHQGIDWQYGGWDRDVLQGDVADNGPNEGDRLLDWDGAYNLYTHCNAAYGGFNDVRQHSPTWQDFLQKLTHGLGAGQVPEDTRTAGTSAFVELALVYPGVDREHGSGRAYPATPGHFDDPNACAD